MKKILVAFCLIFTSLSLQAQEIYQVNGESYELEKAVKSGDIQLLWNVIDGDYRYFIKKDDQIVELTNDRGERGNRYQAEYKQTLEEYTPESDISTENVKLTLNSLRSYIREHNKAVDKFYEYDDSDEAVTRLRFGIFGGVTNSIYTENIDNVKSPVAGIELELYGDNKWQRHSAFTQIRHTFKDSEYDYSKTGISINYRFKVINSEFFHFYLEAEPFELYYYDEPRYIYGVDENTGEVTVTQLENRTDFAVSLPFSLGVGAAIKLGPRTYFTLSYNDFAALGKDNNDEFPIDFTAGLKFNIN